MPDFATAQLLWWIAAAALVIVGLAGTVLPAIPGTILVLGGLVLGAWIDGFTRVGGWTVALIALLAVLAWATDYVAALLGAKKAGASAWAMIGAALGTVAGIFTGFVGLLFLPLAGAVAGEYFARTRNAGLAITAVNNEHATHAAKVGIATWVGMLVGTVVKLVLVFLMIGVFAVAYWI
jgi:uncharacterized protein